MMKIWAKDGRMYAKEGGATVSVPFPEDSSLVSPSGRAVLMSLKEKLKEVASK